MSSGLLDGKVALVTGAARGQGLAEVERFRAEGASVVGGDVLAHDGLYLDVTSASSWAAAVEATVREFGRIDVLVNNAGIDAAGAVDEISEADFRHMLDINLIGPLLGIQAVLPAMGGGGSIINVSSLNGITSRARTAAYTASKFGLRGLTKAAALDLAPRNIRVNAILPGVIETPMIADRIVGREETIASIIPMGRLGRPNDIAEAAIFLASDRSEWITGTDLVVDGGHAAQTPRA